jgi:tRNA threonylcarbamoyl adenosine modification protein YjeE
MNFTTSSEAETVKVATDFAKTLTLKDIVLLKGDLGMGKSVFSRAVIRALSGNMDLNVPSPTFTLIQTYNTELGEVYHFDLYRLKSPEELYEIGWEDALSSGILLVEWPERLGYLTPKTAISVTIQSGKTPESRSITIERPQ